MNVPTHGTDHHGEVRGSTLGREEDGFPFLLVAFRSWYKYKRESLLRVELAGSNEIISETARARHESLECTDHSPYCETARGIQHFQLTVRLRKPCHRRSSHRVASFARDLGQIQMNPSIVSRRKERGKKKRIISNYPSLQRYFIQL